MLLKQDPYPHTPVFFFTHMPLYHSQSYNMYLFWKLWHESKQAKPLSLQSESQRKKQKRICLFQSRYLNLFTLLGFTTLHSFKLSVLKNWKKDTIQKKNGSSEEIAFQLKCEIEQEVVGSSWIRQKTDSYHILLIYTKGSLLLAYPINN